MGATKKSVVANVGHTLFLTKCPAKNKPRLGIDTAQIMELLCVSSIVRQCNIPHSIVHIQDCLIIIHIFVINKACIYASVSFVRKLCLSI